MGWVGGGTLSASSPRRASGTGEHTCMYHILPNSCPVRASGAQGGLPPPSQLLMPASDCGTGFGVGEGVGGPRGDCGRRLANHGAQAPPHSFPGRILGVQPFAQVLRGSVPPEDRL